MSPNLRSNPNPTPVRPERWTRLAFAAAGLLLVLPLAGCRQNMHNQAKAKTYRESDFFADGVEARPLPAHAVARGELREDAVFYTGLSEAGDLATTPPMPVTRELLVRGRERFDVFCSPCHGRLGDGRGMIVQRGFKQPVSFQDERLRNSPLGYFVNNMTEGFGQMPSYAAQIPPEDRWAIASYIRVLQYAESAQVADLSAEERQRLDEAFAAAEAAKAPKQGGHAGTEGEGGH